MFNKKSKDMPWEDGTYLTTAKTRLEADILCSKLSSENIPSIKKYEGSDTYMEEAYGEDLSVPIEIYVPEKFIEDAQNIIVPVDLDDCEPLE